MLAYKLVRKLKSGELAPLFINKRLRLTMGKRYKAECHPTKGFAVRPGWHCTAKPFAPHLSPNGRVWLEVEIDEYTEFTRPATQGGLWFLANDMTPIRLLTDKDVTDILEEK